MQKSEQNGVIYTVSFKPSLTMQVGLGRLSLHYNSSAAQCAIWFGQLCHSSPRSRWKLFFYTGGGGRWACLPCVPRRALFYLVLQFQCLGFRHDVGGGSHGLFITSVDFSAGVRLALLSRCIRCKPKVFPDATPALARSYSTTGFRFIAWPKCTRSKKTKKNKRLQQ